MMLRWIAPVCVALTGCAGTEPRHTAASGDAARAESSATAPDVKQVAMESLEDLGTCRRYVATGTRIGVLRCESKARADDDRVALQQTKQDLDSMRRHQLYQEQARQQAIAEAARRRMAP